MECAVSTGCEVATVDFGSESLEQSTSDRLAVFVDDLAGDVHDRAGVLWSFGGSRVMSAEDVREQSNRSRMQRESQLKPDWHVDSSAATSGVHRCSQLFPRFPVFR